MPFLSCKRSIRSNRSNDNKIGVNIQWHWSEFDNTKGGFFSGFQSIHTHANQTQSFAIIASESEGKKKTEHLASSVGFGEGVRESWAQGYSREE
jgi:hypothetical protein